MVMCHLKLHRLIKVEDWFKDQSTIVRTIRKGKGRQPFIDSVVKMRMQVLIDDQSILSNYPEKDLMTQQPYDFFTSENLKGKTIDEKKEYISTVDADLFKVQLDSYTLPSLVIKVIKTMKKNGVTEITTTRIEKLLSNFENEDIGLNQHEQFKEGQKVTIRITLLDSTYPQYFYKLTVQEKLEHVLRLKATATRFFKSKLHNNFKKAADLYQKINGYFNFGDSTNNYAKQDDTDPDYIRAFEELQSIKLVTFNNLVVCKHKMQEYQSVIGITDQILSDQMDPNNTKALYFRAMAFLKIDEYDDALECAKKLISVDPEHKEGAKLLA